MTTEWTWAEILIMGLLTWLCTAVTMAVGLLIYREWTAPPRPSSRLWEVVETLPTSPADRPLASATEARRVLREIVVEPAPWEGETHPSKPGVEFPESWRWEWPDAPPAPARLPDDEEEASA